MIKISAVSYNNAPLSQSLSAVFGRGGGTLGRSDENTFVLPDAKHIVSRKQAEIRTEGMQHRIANLSRATPIVVNGAELNFGEECLLKTGDEIQIGLYLLRAETHLMPVDVPADQPREDAAAAADKPAAAPVQAETAAAMTSSAPALPANSQALMQAFLNGAGLGQVSLNTDLTPEFMENLGKLVAASVQGTFELLASRASMKRDVKAEVTMIVLRNNNPLKFLSDSETILVQMLRKKMPGFMGPAEAMQDAFEDLQAHQVGMAAGMHAAVAEVLRRFDPIALEKRLKDRSVFDAVLPSHRKAKMWDQYTVLFEDIFKEAQHDFQALFGKAFVVAYEKEIERFHNSR